MYCLSRVLFQELLAGLLELLSLDIEKNYAAIRCLGCEK